MPERDKCIIEKLAIICTYSQFDPFSNCVKFGSFLGSLTIIHILGTLVHFVVSTVYKICFILDF